MSLAFARTTALGVTAALCLLTLPASAQTGTPQRGGGGSGRIEAQTGEAVFAHVCAGCHMPDARGATGAGAYPALAGNAKLASAGYPITLVLNGRKAMPPLGDLLDDDQVAAVVNYVRSHFGNDFKDEVAAAEVKAAR
jgi:mono/diheme cytochrome c family protein